MTEKFKLTIGDMTFTKADFIRRRILSLDDEDLNKLDLKMMEFHWQTLDVMRDVHPRGMSQEEITKAIELKFEKVN